MRLVLDFALVWLTLFYFLPRFTAKLLAFLADNTTGTAADGTVYRVNLSITADQLSSAMGLRGLLVYATLGLYLPWFVFAVLREVAPSAELLENDRTLGVFAFRANEEQFTGLVLRGYLLTLITFGVYWSWLGADATRFLLSSSHVPVPGTHYTVRYSATGWQWFCLAVKAAVLGAMTVGIYLPWAISEYVALQYEHTAFDPSGESPPASDP